MRARTSPRAALRRCPGEAGRSSGREVARYEPEDQVRCRTPSEVSSWVHEGVDWGTSGRRGRFKHRAADVGAVEAPAARESAHIVARRFDDLPARQVDLPDGADGRTSARTHARAKCDDT